MNENLRIFMFVMSLVIILMLGGCTQKNYIENPMVCIILEPSEIIDINPTSYLEGQGISTDDYDSYETICSKNVNKTTKNPRNEEWVALNYFWLIETENKTGICHIKAINLK